MCRCDTRATRGSRRESYPGAPSCRTREQGRRIPPGSRQPCTRRKTVTPSRAIPPDQVTQDRSGPPTAQCSLLLSAQERSPPGPRSRVARVVREQRQPVLRGALLDLDRDRPRQRGHVQPAGRRAVRAVGQALQHIVRGGLRRPSRPRPPRTAPPRTPGPGSPARCRGQGRRRRQPRRPRRSQARASASANSRARRGGVTPGNHDIRLYGETRRPLRYSGDSPEHRHNSYVRGTAKITARSMRPGPAAGLSFCSLATEIIAYPE